MVDFFYIDNAGFQGSSRIGERRTSIFLVLIERFQGQAFLLLFVLQGAAAQAAPHHYVHLQDWLRKQEEVSPAAGDGERDGGGAGGGERAATRRRSRPNAGSVSEEHIE